MAKRDYSCPLYKEWRRKILNRDGRKCTLCKSRKRLHTHHIRTWASCPSLRYDEKNGITLCYLCHGKVNKNELIYQKVLSDLVFLIYKKNRIKKDKNK